MATLGIGALIIWLVGIAIYFLPTIIGYYRKRPNLTAIFVLNLFLGWTFVGWIVSLVWALTTSYVGQQPSNIVINNSHIISPTIPQNARVDSDNISALPQQKLIEKPTIQSHQDKISHLQQLKQLLDAGILTQEEFEQQKSKILA